MIRAGLTGGIATGKSTVSRKFAELGAHIIDADEISREVMVPHSACWKKVTAAFGRTILHEDATINRKKLASLVFTDPQKLIQLNHLVHPEILARIEEHLSLLEAKIPDAVAVVDAALLVETGAYKKFDKLIVVYASEEIQIARLVKRDGMSPQEARNRISAQLPMSEKLAVADYVINNESSLEVLYRQTEEVFSSLHALRQH